MKRLSQISQLALVAVLSLGIAACGSDKERAPAADNQQQVPTQPGEPQPPAEDTQAAFHIPDEAIPAGATKTPVAIGEGATATSVDSKSGPKLPSYSGTGVRLPEPIIDGLFTTSPAVTTHAFRLRAGTTPPTVSDIASALLADFKTYLDGAGTLASGGFDELINQTIQGSQGDIATRVVDVQLNSTQSVAQLRSTLINQLLVKEVVWPTLAQESTDKFRLTLAIFRANGEVWMWLGLYPTAQVAKAPAYASLNAGTAQSVSSEASRTTNTETFQQTQNVQSDADFLLVVDNSGSMSQEQQAVADVADMLLTSLNSTSLNYHLAVARTGDQGGLGACYDLSALSNGDRFISPSTVDASTEFKSIATPGTNGSSNETGLFCAEQVFLDANQVNTGFDRASAPNIILILSDEPDNETLNQRQPTGAPAGYMPQDLKHYIEYFTQTNPASVFTIVGPSDASRMTFQDSEYGSSYSAEYSCSGPGGSASGGANYREVSHATQGSQASICVEPSSYETLFDNMVQTATGLASQFELTQNPFGGTATVTVNGQAVPHDPNHIEGFDVIFSAAKAALVFYGTAIPSAGDTIVVTYEYNQ